MMDNKTIEKINAHYKHACTKHPHFCDKLFVKQKSSDFAICVQEDLSATRDIVKMLIENGAISAQWLLRCEFEEIQEAFARGDIDNAVEECYDAIAVLLRVVDALEGRQALGKPVETKEEASARVWCRKDPTRKCVDCEGCPTTEGGAE